MNALSQASSGVLQKVSLCMKRYIKKYMILNKILGKRIGEADIRHEQEQL